MPCQLKAALWKYIDENADGFRHLRLDAMNFLVVFTGSKTMRAINDVRDKYLTKGGGCDMYFALDDLVEESIEKAKMEGFHLAVAVLKLNAQGLSVEEIASKCNTSTDMVEMIIQKLNSLISASCLHE